jgi:hypothetical protein
MISGTHAIAAGVQIKRPGCKLRRDHEIGHLEHMIAQASK